MLRELSVDVVDAVFGDGMVGAWQEEDEFITAESYGEVAFAEVGGDDLCEHFEKPVADGVAACIVDGFEVVEVDDDGDDIGIGLSAFGDERFE